MCGQGWNNHERKNTLGCYNAHRMDATATAIQSISPIATGDVITGNIDFWIKLISVFSTAFTVSLAFILALLLYLTWSHNKQRERAESELEKLIDIRKKGEALYYSHQNLLTQAKKENLEIGKELKGARLGKKKIEELAEKSEALDKTLNSLATVSYPPSGSASASLSKPSDVRQDYIRGIKDTMEKDKSPKYTKEEIEAALKLLKG